MDLHGLGRPPCRRLRRRKERLLADGYEDDAVPALAARVAAGDDLTGFGYQWAHEDDAAKPAVEERLRRIEALAASRQRP